MYCKMGFPSFGGTRGLGGMRLVREYQDKKMLKGRLERGAGLN